MMTKYFFRHKNHKNFAFCVILFIALVTVLLICQVKELFYYKRFRLLKMSQNTQQHHTRLSNPNVSNANVVHYNLLEEKIGLKKNNIIECNLGKVGIKEKIMGQLKIL
jgi:hypothetical protein